MLFNSWQFLVFFHITIALYFLIPARYRNICLLAANLVFYASAGIAGLFTLIICSVWTYLAAVMLEKEMASQRNVLAKTSHVQGHPQGHAQGHAPGHPKFILSISLLGLFSALIFFKYTGFLLRNLALLFGLMSIPAHVPAYSPILPVGISFFIFQMAGYLIDIYRGNLPAERSFFRFFLFVSFFPQMLAGPIPRGKELLPQFHTPHTWNYERAVDGFALMIWGFILKMVIADRAALLSDVVFTYYNCYTSPVLILGALVFTVQIYCDFYGYTLIARGAARVLGFELNENFRNPYLAASVQEFWRRWHISLSSWFRDYLYFPLGGSRRGTLKKYRNILIVFLISGLWHGSEWTFICWGLLNGIYQILESIFHLKPSPIIGRIRTLILITLTWVFFKARSLEVAVGYLLQMFCLKKPAPTEEIGLIRMADGIPGMAVSEFILLIVAALILLFADIYRERGRRVYERICEGPWIVRPVMLALGVLFIVVMGVWGSAYQAAGFLYFKF